MDLEQRKRINHADFWTQRHDGGPISIKSLRMLERRFDKIWNYDVLYYQIHYGKQKKRLVRRMAENNVM
jgi:hypothetical protein